MRKILSLFFILFTLLPSLAKANNDLIIPPGYVLFDKIVVVVNGTPVLKSEVDLFKEFYRIPDEKRALEDLVNQILLAQAAERMGLKVSPEEIDMFLQDLARRNNLTSTEELLSLLTKSGVSIVEFKNLIRRQILVNKFVSAYIRDKIFEDMETGNGKTEDVATIQVIVLNKNTPFFKEKYEELKKEIGKESFANLFSKYNEDEALIDNQGIIENVKKGYLAEAIDKEIWQRNKGDVFEVDTPEKVYFIKIIDKKRKLSENEINEEELNKRIQEEIDRVLEKLKENSVITYLN